MKKQKIKVRILTKSEESKITEALHFFEDFGKTITSKDSPTKLISIRIPKNILNVLKFKAQYEGKKYQSMIIHALREYLRKDIK